MLVYILYLYHLILLSCNLNDYNILYFFNYYIFFSPGSLWISVSLLNGPPWQKCEDYLEYLLTIYCYFTDSVLVKIY